MKNLGKYLFLFSIGGGVYYTIENIFRGFSHWTMFVLGGICFICCGLLDEGPQGQSSIWLQMAAGTSIITSLELAAGIILNIWLKLNIWDYGNRAFNFMGQICILFMIIWYFASYAAFVADDYLRYWFFGEEKTGYLEKLIKGVSKKTGRLPEHGHNR